jgi:hypothetical protein
MNEHQLDSLDFGGHSGWLATCTCHNPDSDGVGRADFPGDTAYEAYLAWAEHAVAQEPKLPTRPTHEHDKARAKAIDFEHGDVTVRKDLYGVIITLESRTGTAWMHIDEDGWNSLRQYRP